MQIKILCLLILVVFLSGCKKEADSNSLPEVPHLLELSSATLNADSIAWSETRERMATVIIFLSPLCPIAQKYISRVEAIYDEFHPLQVEFYGVFPGNLADKKEAKRFKSDYQLDFDLLKDTDLALTKELGATTSPEVFVIDQKGKVRYQGQIDNWFFALGKKRSVVTENYLSDALKAIIDGKPIRQKRTKAVGCYLPRK